MANIREYQSRQGFQPTGRAAGAAADTAAGWASTWAQVGQKVGSSIAVAGEVAMDLKEEYDQQEVSKGAELATRRVDELTQQWQNLTRSRDPGDETVFEDFTDKILEPELEKFQEAFHTKSGQKWATDQVTKIRNHFFTTARADVSSRAGIAAVMNVEKSTNNLAMNANRDPSSLDFVLEMSNDTFNAIRGGLATDADTSARFDAAVRERQKEIVFGGLKGMADRNPAQFLADQAAGAFDKYDQYLSVDEKLSLRQYGESAKNAADADATAAREERTRVEKAQVVGAVNGIYKEYLDIDASGATYVKPGAHAAVLQLAGMPGADENLVTSTSSALRSIEADTRARKNRTSDPYVLGDFNARLYLPDDDPNRLTIEDVNRMRAPAVDGTVYLSTQDFNYYRQAILQKDPALIAANKEFDIAFRAYSGFINSVPIGGTGTPEGQQRENEFRLAKWREFQNRITIKKQSSAEALNGLFDDYKRYQVSSDSALQGIVDGVSNGRTALPPVVIDPAMTYKPGEDIGAYAARLQGGKATPLRKPSIREFDERFGE